MGMPVLALCLLRDADRDGVTNRVDACRTEPETLNGYQDEDGCPDFEPVVVEAPTRQVRVADLDPRLASSTVEAGGLRLTGRSGYAMHTHGGDEARLDSARFEVSNTGNEPMEVVPVGVEFLTGHSCGQLPSSISAAPALLNPVPVRLEPGEVRELVVRFAPVGAYYAHCDRFAFRVGFDVGGHTLVVVAETLVAREDPLPGDL